MLRLDRLQTATSGLASELDESSPSLAQNSAIALPPQNSNCATEPLSSSKAITILLDQNDDDAIAYLRLARSLYQNVQRSSNYASLSADQVRAVWTLRDCSDVDIRTWLKEARTLVSVSAQPVSPPGDCPQESSFSHLSSSGQVRKNLHVPAGRTSPNLVQTEDSPQSTFDASCPHPKRALTKTDASQEATKATNLYWCTVCKDPHSYKNYSDWRKHEKEHVETYVCMLGNPIDETGRCVKCRLCGALNPSENHLSTHSTQMCGQGVPGSFSCKRRDHMVRHLKRCHNVQGKAQGEAVADRWKETTKKQAWSCGFCVHVFHTFGDRLKHIARHFECGQTLDEWDSLNVIEGLLLQPGLIRALDLPLDWRSSGRLWQQGFVEELQHDLEIGPSGPMHATALVKRVYNALQSSHDRSFTLAPAHGALGPNALVPTSDNDSIMKQAYQPCLNHDQSQFVNPAHTLHNGVSAIGGNLMTNYGYHTMPTSFSDEDTSSTKTPWQLDPGQKLCSAADPYFGYSANQEDSNTTSGRYAWSTPAIPDDDPNANDMLA